MHLLTGEPYPNLHAPSSVLVMSGLIDIGLCLGVQSVPNCENTKDGPFFRDNS